MTGYRKAGLGLLGLAMLCCAMVPVLAQTAAEPIKGPETTSARYADWLMRCSSVQGIKTCEIVQQLQMQVEGGRQTPIAVLALGRVAKDQPLKFIAQLPSNITIANGIVVETKPDKAISGTFQRCLPIGCFADFVVTDEVRKRWQQRNQPGSVLFHDGAGKLVTLPLSFRGFSQAMEAMLRETR